MASLRTGLCGLSSECEKHKSVSHASCITDGSRDNSQVIVTHPISDFLRLQAASLCVGHLFCLAEKELPSCFPWER